MILSKQLSINLIKTQLSPYHRTTAQSCVVIVLHCSMFLLLEPKTIYLKVLLYLFSKSSLVLFHFFLLILGHVWRYLCTAILYATLILVSPVPKNSFACEVLGIQLADEL